MNARLIIMNALVLRHLHYSSTVLNSITQNLVVSLDQQFDFAIKSCFNRRNLDSSRDFKVQNRVLPIRCFLDFKLFCFFSGGCHKKNKRTRGMDCQVRHRTSILENCLIKRECKLCKTYHARHPDSTSKYNYNTVKTKFKQNFFELFLETRDTKVYGKLSRKEFRKSKL